MKRHYENQATVMLENHINDINRKFEDDKLLHARNIKVLEDAKNDSDNVIQLLRKEIHNIR